MKGLEEVLAQSGPPKLVPAAAGGHPHYAQDEAGAAEGDRNLGRGARTIDEFYLETVSRLLDVVFARGDEDG